MSNNANAEHVASYYAATSNPSPERAALVGDIECEVCVVGAGFTGISSALHLVEQGRRVVVLEAARVGFGASGRNGGQIVNSYSRDMDVIEAKYGTGTARALGDMAFEGNRIIRERIRHYAIACDLKNGNLFAACNRKQFEGCASTRRCGNGSATTNSSCWRARLTGERWAARATSARWWITPVGTCIRSTWCSARPPPSRRWVASSMNRRRSSR